MPRFSIVMPVYNAESFIEATLDSLLSQTFADIEVIAVDDASTDGSGTVLDRCAAKDSRLKVVHHRENTYTGQARKDGVLCSSGDYILFVDQDDALVSDACEKLASFTKDHPVDIIHFGTRGVISDDVDEGYQKELDSFLSPYVGELAGRDVLDGCFFDRKYSWNVWNKLYRADLCKKAHEYVDMTNVRYGEDFYAYFVMAFYANSYYGIDDEMYTYHYGSGQTGHSRVDMKSFRFICTASVVVDEIERFAHAQAASQERRLVDKVRSLLIWEPACMLKSNVAACDKSEALHVFFAAWGLNASLDVLRRLYEGEEALLAHELHAAAVSASEDGTSGRLEAKLSSLSICSEAEDGGRLGADSSALEKLLYEWFVEARKNNQLEARLELLAKSNGQLELRLKRVTAELEGTLQSTAWKVGRFMTWIPRRLKDLLSSFLLR
ncbi:glycosyltransferase family 2 protein [Adlercreutzia sp. ZJ473]|uniref:glycosyltransferase family 2 protein n=1 Tax=Adlercreutzia sp. ZJ473 TaxID=2722822 RepID=UPI001557E7BE